MSIGWRYAVASALLLSLGTCKGNQEILQEYDTIVVGLGAAGTMAASTLARAGKKVLALEAQDRIGGRVYTVPFGDGVVEVGAEWSKWFTNEFVRGTYSYDSMGAVDVPSARSDLASPLVDASGKPRVLFAGEASHPTRFATVHGAADTGHREAKRLQLSAVKNN